MDLPQMPPLDARETCIVQTAKHFNMPKELIRAVIRTEGGSTGKISRNQNGSYDMGLMQINSIHLPAFSLYGITREQLIKDECLNIQIGTYLLKINIAQTGNFWHGVGRYHSATPAKNIAYQQRVWRHVIHLRANRDAAPRRLASASPEKP